MTVRTKIYRDIRNLVDRANRQLANPNAKTPEDLREISASLANLAEDLAVANLHTSHDESMVNVNVNVVQGSRLISVAKNMPLEGLDELVTDLLQEGWPTVTVARAFGCQ